MRSISFEEATAVGGGMIGAGPGDYLLSSGGTQTFDDGSMLVYRENGSLAGAITTDGYWREAVTTVTPQLHPLWEAVPVIGPFVSSWNDLGRYNSASGSGPLGSQDLPPSLPMMP
ncbi:MAG: hypothetical protein ACKO15_00685 [Burkholderiales bacterium]